MRYVYLVRAGENNYKIGVSRNVQKRIASLQTSNIHLIELICAKRTIDDTGIEKGLHKLVRAYGGTGGSEWFKLTPEQAIEVAILISKSPDVDIADNIISDLKSEIGKIIDTYELKIRTQKETLEAERKAFEEQRINHAVLGYKRNNSSTIRTNAKVDWQHEDDLKYSEAKNAVLENRSPSASFLQRKLGIGYARAARYIDRMEEEGLISPLDGITRRIL